MIWDGREELSVFGRMVMVVQVSIRLVAVYRCTMTDRLAVGTHALMMIRPFVSLIMLFTGCVNTANQRIHLRIV